MQGYKAGKLAQETRRLEELRKLHQIALRRARLCTSEAVEEVMEELARRREAVRDAYGHVDTSDFPNKVVATFSALQGQEREIAMQIAMWETAKERKKEVDEQIRICENNIMELEKETR